MKNKIYKSKFGWGVFLFIAILLGIVIWLSYNPEKGVLGSMVLVLITLATLGLFIAMSLGTKYSISAIELHIKSFPFYNKGIAIASIKKIEVSHNLISSPAPSLDRIEIYFDKDESIVISPKDKFQFMEDLKQLNPVIELVKK